MNWKFWLKSNASQASRGLPKPKDLPESVGRYLVVDLQKDPDWVWTLKAVMRHREDNRDIKDIRIFNPARVDAVNGTVRNYHSLDETPELILFEGWLNTKTHQMELVEKLTEKAA
jgi:hypothetical protein